MIYNEQELIFRLSQIMEMTRLDDEAAAENLMRDLLAEMDCEEDRREMGVLFDKCCEDRYAYEYQLRDNHMEGEWLLKVTRACSVIQDKLWCAGICAVIAPLIMASMGVYPIAAFTIFLAIVAVSLLVLVGQVMVAKRIESLAKDSQMIVRKMPDVESIAKEFMQRRRSNE